MLGFGVWSFSGLPYNFGNPISIVLILRAIVNSVQEMYQEGSVFTDVREEIALK